MHIPLLEIEYVEGIPQYFTRGLLSSIQIPREIQYFHPNVGYEAYLLRYGFNQHIYDGVKEDYVPGILANLSFRLLTFLFILKTIQINTTFTQEKEFDQLLFEVNRMFCDESRLNFYPEILEEPFGPSNESKSFTSIAEKFNFPTDKDIPLINNDDFNTLFENLVGKFRSV